MKRILEYQLTTDGFQTINMRHGAEVISVIIKQGVVTLCVIADDSEIMEQRTFAVWGTGWCIEEDDLDNFKFLASVNHEAFGQSMVWHVFEQDLPVAPQRNGDCPVCGSMPISTTPHIFPYQRRCLVCGLYSVQEEPNGPVKIELAGEQFILTSDTDDEDEESARLSKAIDKAREALE